MAAGGKSIIENARVFDTVAPPPVISAFWRQRQRGAVIWPFGHDPRAAEMIVAHTNLSTARQASG